MIMVVGLSSWVGGWVLHDRLNSYSCNVCYIIYKYSGLAEGEECSVLDGWSAQGADEALVESLTGRSSGALARAVLATLRRAIIPCRDGLLCTRVGLHRKECRPLDRNSEFITIIIFNIIHIVNEYNTKTCSFIL